MKFFLFNSIAVVAAGLVGCADAPGDRIFGELVKDDLKDFLDLSGRELAIFVPLIIVVIWMGIYPSTFLDVMHVSVENLLNQYHAALAAVEGAR